MYIFSIFMKVKVVLKIIFLKVVLKIFFLNVDQVIILCGTEK